MRNDRLILWKCMTVLGSAALAAACSGQMPFATDSATASAPARPVVAAADVAASTPVQPPVALASASGFAVAGVLAPDQGVGLGEYIWNDEGVAAGPLTVVVDLQRQILYAYRGGVEIGRSAILYGADDKPTPTGAFPILEKDADHVSNLYGAPMPYMLRLTWDGVAIHGSNVEYGSATNGCVGVPDEFAALLFAQAKLGDRVLVTKGWRKDIYGA